MSSIPRIAFVTLGCAKNEVDSDKMQARLAAAGFEVVDDCSIADLAIVNTCAFLSSAVEEGLEVIFDLANAKRPDGSSLKILVAGCMPSRYGDQLRDELIEASGFLGVHDEDHVVDAVEELLGVPAPMTDSPSVCCGQQIRFITGPSAYVKISDGCDRFCSYCMIPHIRGRYHSYPLDTISSEVEDLIDKGAREIVLIGQDTGIWGRDLPMPDTTAHLVSYLAERHPKVWFRLLYVQPEGISEELLDAMASHDNICSYFDMPLQHADEQVIANMNRRGGASEYLKLVRHIRERVPGVLLRTTLMAGFPGETQEQFDVMLDFVEEAEFEYAAVFPFSPEEGSAAFDFDGQIDEDIRMERAQVLLDTCEVIGTARVAKQIGMETVVLVEGYEETDVGLEALCRTQGQAPEVDGQVHVPISSAGELPIGTFAHVKLTGSFFYELEGEVVSS